MSHQIGPNTHRPLRSCVVASKGITRRPKRRSADASDPMKKFVGDWSESSRDTASTTSALPRTVAALKRERRRKISMPPEGEGDDVDVDVLMMTSSIVRIWTSSSMMMIKMMMMRFVIVGESNEDIDDIDK